MSNVSYISGTVEYLVVEVECDTPDVVFVPSEWEAEVALVAVGVPFDDDAVPSIWADAVLEEFESRNYCRILIGDAINPAPGNYRALVRLTKKVDGLEIPLLRAVGTITIENG